MFKKIKEHKDQITFVSIYAAAIVVTAGVTYYVTKAVYQMDNAAMREMLSNPYLDDIRLYGITELRKV